MALAQSDLSRYIDDIRHYPVLTPEEEQRLAVRYYEDGDVEAARALVLGNLRFALKVALDYARYAPVMDLIQEANLGLMEAVRRFNPYRGYRLVTYAVWWIRAFIQRFVIESSSVVRRGTTRDERKAQRKLRPTRRALEQATGEEASVQDLAEALDVSEDAIVAVTQSQDVSLDAPVGDEEGGAALGDFLVASTAGPEDELLTSEHQNLLQRALDDVMGELDDREREIMATRLLSEAPATLQELADSYGISRERVRQIEARVKGKLESHLKTLDIEPLQKALPRGGAEK